MYSVPKTINLMHLLVNCKFMLSDIYTKVLILRRQFDKNEITLIRSIEERLFRNILIL